MDNRVTKTTGHKYAPSNYSFKLKKLAQLKSYVPKCTKNFEREKYHQCQTVNTSILADMHRGKYSSHEGTSSVAIHKKDGEISSQKSESESQ
jgi:hypothetical protein